MNDNPLSFTRPAALLAVNLLFVMVWGFAGIGKLLEGSPPWFPEKFGNTFFASFPGLTLTFWILALSEMFALLLGFVALVQLEFLGRRRPSLLAAMLVWSLFVFLQLGFGQWLTADYEGGFHQFMYFSGTLLALDFVQRRG